MKYYIPLSLFLLLFTACESSQEVETVTSIEIEQNNPHDIELINGEKWTVDEGMMANIEVIVNDVQSFQGTTVEDYKEYSSTLSSHISELTSNCTMKGQGHDELHKWLVPFIRLSKDLKKVESIGELNKIDGELKSEIVVFGDYFK